MQVHLVRKEDAVQFDAILDDSRHARMPLRSPLGDGVLRLVNFRGFEGLSRLFEYELLVLSDRSEIEPSTIVGKRLSFGIDCDDKETRWFNGFVSQFEPLEGTPSGEQWAYRITVVPWLWLLTKRSNCRIFQNKTVRDILTELFRDHADVCAVKFNTVENSRVLPYSIQYGETDFAFVSRLLAEEGLFFWFEHTASAHQMVVTDVAKYRTVVPEPEIRWSGGAGGPIADDSVSTWRSVSELRSRYFVQRDFDYEEPRKSLQAQYQVPRSQMPWTDPTLLELFQFTGLYADKQQGDRLRRRCEAETVASEQVYGRGSISGLAPGVVTRVARSPRSGDIDRQFVVVEISHTTDLGHRYESGLPADGPPYEVEFTCIPAKSAFRPQMPASKPLMIGLQTATVVGPRGTGSQNGHRIHVDELGRVKIRFHWDRADKDDDSVSCWVRVAQPWAGPGMGMLAIPRIGCEVLVAFIDGDPDRPIIVGQLHNGDDAPPVSTVGREDRNAKKTPDAPGVMTIRSQSLDGSGGYNEISMDDTDGQETLYFRATRDEVHEVLKDRNDEVGGDEHSRVKGNRKRDVSKDDTLTVSGSRRVNVTGEHQIDVKAASKHSATEITIEASAKLTLTCGASKIVLDPASVTISGPVIKLN